MLNVTFQRQKKRQGLKTSHSKPTKKTKLDTGKEEAGEDNSEHPVLTGEETDQPTLAVDAEDGATPVTSEGEAGRSVVGER